MFLVSYKESSKEKEIKDQHGELNGHTTEEAIVEMMLRNVHNIKGRLIDLEKKLTKVCLS